jgi:hypothetical protein
MDLAGIGSDRPSPMNLPLLGGAVDRDHPLWTLAVYARLLAFELPTTRQVRAALVGWGRAPLGVLGRSRR